MIIVQGFMRVDASRVQLYRKRLALHIALVQTLDGCLQYSLSEDFDEPGLLWIGERWRDGAAHAAHSAGNHMGEFNVFMKHMNLSAAHFAKYDVAGEGEWLMRIGQERLP
jgi:quinol monooxygenase YgiN